MTQSTNDVPRLIVFPPLIPLVAIIFTAVLQWLCPLGLLAHVAPLYRGSLGVALFAAGAALMAAGAYEFSRNDTPVKPSLPTTKLVTTGVYAWTRNPFYVGGSCGLLGVAIALGIDWWPILFVVSFVFLHFGIVLPEERYLAQKFGVAYRRYRDTAPRYFGPF